MKNNLQGSKLQSFQLFWYSFMGFKSARIDNSVCGSFLHVSFILPVQLGVCDFWWPSIITIMWNKNTKEQKDVEIPI